MKINIFNWKPFLSILALVLVTVVVGGLLVWQNQINQFKRLTVGRYSDAISLDPAMATDLESFQVTSNIYETLVKYQRDGSIAPSLAEKWEVSEDNRVWSFYIRKNVQFHDGTPLNAQAIAFNFNRWMDHNSPYHTGKFSYWSYSFGKYPDLIKSVTAISDTRLEIVLSEPFAPFLSTLTLPALAIASPDAIMKYNDTLTEHPVGTGPFSFKSWEKNSSILLEKNKKYWNQKAKVNQVEFRTLGRDQDAEALLASGQLHIMENMHPGDLEEISQDQQINTYYRPLFNTGYLALNNQSELFSQVAARRAVSYLIDKDELMEKAFSPLSRPASTFLPPAVIGHNENIKSPSYNPALASRLLAQADLQDGLEINLAVMDNPRSYFSNPLETARVIQESMQKAGIKVNIQAMAWPEFLEYLKAGKHEMALIGWQGDVLDPDNFLSPLFSSENPLPMANFNYAFYRNDEVDRLLKQARRITDMEFRRTIYRELQEIIYQDMASIPLAHTMSVVGVSQSVSGFEPGVTGLEVLNEVHIDEL